MNTQFLTICLSVFLIVLGVMFARLSIYYLIHRRANNSLADYVRGLFEEPILKSSAVTSQEVTADPAQESDRKSKKIDWHIDFWQGVSTEMVGAVITTILLTVIVSIVQDAADRETYRKDLIRNLGSSDNGFALQSVDLLREEGWLMDGTLAEISLTAADLRNADLSNANLTGVDLRFADLRGANLFNANLSNADLRYTLMQQVNTRDLFDVDDARQALRDKLFDFERLAEAPFNFAAIAILQAWAYSTRANLQGADLRFADLSGSDLSFSDFSDAILLDARFNGANLFMVDLSGAIVSEDLGGILAGDTPVSYSGNPPLLDNDTLLPHGHLGRPNVDLHDFNDSSTRDHENISVCRNFVVSPNALESNPPINCGLIFVIIPYPERQPGPFRE